MRNRVLCTPGSCRFGKRDYLLLKLRFVGTHKLIKPLSILTGKRKLGDARVSHDELSSCNTKRYALCNTIKLWFPSYEYLHKNMSMKHQCFLWKFLLHKLLTWELLIHTEYRSQKHTLWSE